MAKTPFKKILTTSREFKYVKNKVNLSFSLFIDDRENVKDFKELLQEALKDVNEILEVN